MNEKNNKRKISILIASVTLVIVLLIGVTYAYFSSTTNTSAKTVQAGTLRIQYETDALNTVRLDNIAPIYDNEITTKASKIAFTVRNNGTSKAYTSISLTDIVMDSELSNLEFKWALYSGNTKISNGNLRNVTNGKQLLMNNLEINSGVSTPYIVYIWISESGLDQSALMNRTFSAKITVEGSQNEQAKLLSQKIKEDNTPVTTASNFANTATTDEGLIQGVDKDGETYYFRGAVQDNYISISDTVISDDTGKYVSNNAGVNNSSAESTIQFTATQNGTISFDYLVSSEKNYDKLKISLNGTQIVETSGETSNNVTESITSGTSYTLTFKYEKDRSSASGEDKAVISNLAITGITNPTMATSGDYGFVEGGPNYDLYRIVRINGSGTVRIIKDTTVGKSAFNTNYNNEKYIGYTYDNSAPNVQDGTSSTIKNYLDNENDGWYKTNLSSYDNLIAYERYCNDTSVSSTSEGNIYYGTYGRLNTNNNHTPEPTFICPITDKTYGGEYDLKIGLLTSDEAAYASGFGVEYYSQYYLEGPSWWWVGSPDYFSGNFAYEFNVYSDGCINCYDTVENTYGSVRPVINLKSDILYSRGSGTKYDPYVISAS